MTDILAAMAFPALDPVAIEIGPFAIKWYGISYMVGLLLGWLYIRRLVRETHLWSGGVPPFTPQKVDDLLIYMTIGTILGGRVGYTLLYEPAGYLSNPLEILKVWKGGMAFHGALIGCGLAIWVFAARNKTSFLSTADVCVAANPIGLFFGRLANFINGELYGRPTDMPWGMVFPEAARLQPAVEPVMRHPSQLYEALLEGLLLFLVLRLLTHKFEALKRPGMVSGAFLAGYAVARIIGEMFREPHGGHPLNFGPLTAGMIYSIPMLLVGAWLIWRAMKTDVRAAA